MYKEMYTNHNNNSDVNQSCIMLS